MSESDDMGIVSSSDVMMIVEHQPQQHQMEDIHYFDKIPFDVKNIIFGYLFHDKVRSFGDWNVKAKASLTKLLPVYKSMYRVCKDWNEWFNQQEYHQIVLMLSLMFNPSFQSDDVQVSYRINRWIPDTPLVLYLSLKARNHGDVMMEYLRLPKSRSFDTIVLNFHHFYGFFSEYFKLMKDNLTDLSTENDSKMLIHTKNLRIEIENGIWTTNRQALIEYGELLIEIKDLLAKLSNNECTLTYPIVCRRCHKVEVDADELFERSIMFHNQVPKTIQCCHCNKSIVLTDDCGCGFSHYDCQCPHSINEEFSCVDCAALHCCPTCHVGKYYVSNHTVMYCPIDYM